MLHKLIDIFKKSGESKIIVLDKEAGEFYVLTKWNEYEKLLTSRDEKTRVMTQQDTASTDNISDEERFFLEPSE